MRGITLVLLWIAVVITATTMTVVSGSSRTATASVVGAAAATTTTTTNGPEQTLCAAMPHSPSSKQPLQTRTCSSSRSGAKPPTEAPSATAATSVMSLKTSVPKMKKNCTDTATNGNLKTRCLVDPIAQTTTTTTTTTTTAAVTLNWNDFGTWPPLGLIGIALFTIFALIAHPDGLAWVLLGKIIITIQATTIILREFWGSVFGGPGFLPTLFAAATLIGLVWMLVSMIGNTLPRRTKGSIKQDSLSSTRKKRKRKNQNSRHKRKDNLDKQSISDNGSLSSTSGHQSFADGAATNPRNCSVPPVQQVSPSTITSITSLKHELPPSTARGSNRESVPDRAQSMPSESRVALRPPLSPSGTRSKVRQPNKKQHPETVSVPNLEGGFADDQSCESSLSLPSLGNSDGSNRTEKGRTKKQRKPKQNQKPNAPLSNRRQEKQQSHQQREKGQKAATAAARRAGEKEIRLQPVSSSRWDALKPSTPVPKGSEHHPNQHRHHGINQQTPYSHHQPPPRTHQKHNVPRGGKGQQNHNHHIPNQSTPRSHADDKQHTPRPNSRRGGKKNRNALNNSVHKSTSRSPASRSSISPKSTKRVVYKSTPAPMPSLPTPKNISPFPSTPGSNTQTPTTLAPPPGLTRSTPSDDFFDSAPLRSSFTPSSVVRSTLMIPESTFVTPSRPPNVAPSSSPFDPSCLGISASKDTTPSTWSSDHTSTPSRYMSPMSLYANEFDFGGDDDAILKENPFANDEDSQIEADLKELGGQMAGSILDF